MAISTVRQMQYERINNEKGMATCESQGAQAAKANAMMDKSREREVQRIVHVMSVTSSSKSVLSFLNEVTPIFMPFAVSILRLLGDTRSAEMAIWNPRRMPSTLMAVSRMLDIFPCTPEVKSIIIGASAINKGITSDLAKCQKPLILK